MEPKKQRIKKRASSPAPVRPKLIGVDGDPVEALLDAIREHRATKTPATWTNADRRLYQFLPELNA